MILPPNLGEDQKKKYSRTVELIFVELKIGFARNRLPYDILFQIIWGEDKKILGV